jgi:short-subunit dehydrogenase
MVEAVVGHFGRLDILINNAGGAHGHVGLHRMDLAKWDRDIQLNLSAAQYCAQAAIPHLKQSQGALVNLGSEVSEAVIPLQGIYSASKHAVKGFNDTLRIEFEHDKVPVSVTLIQPGATNTPFPQHARNYLDKEPKLPTPLDEPFDVAKAILEAATHEKKSIKVSATSKLDVLMGKFAPPMADKMGVKQMDRQTMEKSPLNPAGALHQPGPPSGRVHGTEASA